ncbi:hypothetical protein [Hymenobacter norwichensis]|uniref:hypothetical protein n=1 Tax=Hymenobacter norwichensis TaxID=223903 RepID=UPI0003B40CD1|nr:hypothetical protein [Hymenobacter norwichensis]
MDQETVRYIIDYHKDLLSESEQWALRHILYKEKLAVVQGEAIKARLLLTDQQQRRLITDQAVLNRLADGPDAFLYNTAIRVFNEHGGEKLLNLWAAYPNPHCPAVPPLRP